MSEQPWTLGGSFLRTARRVPERVALDLAEATWTYATLLEKSASIAATLQRERPNPEPPLTAVFCDLTGTQFAGVLGALLAGSGYVPLDSRLPVERLRLILQLSLTDTIIVDSSGALHLDELLDGMDRRMLIILPEEASTSMAAAKHPKHRIIAADQLACASEWRAVDVSQDSIAYLMFTSGSTGRPKGVMVTHRNIEHYVRCITQLYELSEADRFSALNSFGFDMSIFDYFIPWEVGAAICGPRKEHSINCVRYVNDLSLTVWYSVPGKAIVAKQLGLLKSGAMPTLRISGWAGESFSVDLMDAWSAAAPNSVLDNHYGPTEVTNTCMVYRYDSSKSHAESEHGLMPIGVAYPGMKTRVLDEQKRPVAPGEVGELVLVGPQVSKGYWNDPLRTAGVFIADPITGEPAYCTGDLARMPEEGSPMNLLGRRDFQINVLGGRIELGDVEAALRNATGADTVIAMGWDVTGNSARYLVAFIAAESVDTNALNAKLQKTLPAFAVPKRIMAVPQMPLNANGKIDRNALRAMMEKA